MNTRKQHKLSKSRYAENDCYYFTICTKYRFPFFGTIGRNKMALSEIGKITQKQWYDLPSHYLDTRLDAFIIMPDHIHGILVLHKRAGKLPERAGQATAPTHKICSVSTIIGSYKSGVSRLARRIDPDFSWQRSFYDRVIRDVNDLERTRQYINNNPMNRSTEP